MQMTPPFMAESEEELKSLLMNVKEESEKVGFKFNRHLKNILKKKNKTLNCGSLGGKISRVTIYSLDVLLFLFETSLLFHVQF